MKSDAKKLTVEQCKDSGLALVLLLLIGYRFWELPLLLLLAVVVLLAAMACPSLYRPFARVWFGLSAVMGTVMSKIILTILFFAVVLPVGRLRRAMGKDPMRIGCWKDGSGSVFRKREHRFLARDLEHPY